MLRPDTPENRLYAQLAQLLDARGADLADVVARLEELAGPVTVAVVVERSHVRVTAGDVVYSITRPADRRWELPKVSSSPR